MSRVIAIMACGFMLTACSATMPSLSLDFMKSAPQAETLAIESEPPGAEAKTSLGQSCRTPCQLPVQPGSEFSVTLALSGYQPQTVSVRPEADSASATPRLAPNPIRVTLQAVAQPKKPVLKKKKPVVAAARPAASPPVASAAPTAAPAPAPALAPPPSSPAEAAASATNYPWPSR
jgi:PEGA domain